MVGRMALNHEIGVRFPVPEQLIKPPYGGFINSRNRTEPHPRPGRIRKPKVSDWGSGRGGWFGEPLGYLAKGEAKSLSRNNKILAGEANAGMIFLPRKITRRCLDLGERRRFDRARLCGLFTTKIILGVN